MVIYQLFMICRNFDIGMYIVYFSIDDICINVIFFGVVFEFVRKKIQDGGGCMYVEEKDSIQQFLFVMKVIFLGIEVMLDCFYKFGVFICYVLVG